jgi:hypothetical protein
MPASFFNFFHSLKLPERSGAGIMPEASGLWSSQLKPQQGDPDK